MPSGHAVRAVCLVVALVAPACGLLHGHRETPAPNVVDLNAGSRRAIENLPGVTPSMARRIVEGRPYGDAHELVDRRILTEREFGRIVDRVTVRGRP
ncbi:MAG: hypothetical protein E6J56_07335 [Deltaproteobacteria bacterium]|nr:MAG: hypothetical protein E6J56_07335 [Deltaproteobacteria bacterium]